MIYIITCVVKVKGTFGFEPRAYRTAADCSTTELYPQVRRPGIEPRSQEWESCMIPLHQRRCCIRGICSHILITTILVSVC